MGLSHPPLRVHPPPSRDQSVLSLLFCSLATIQEADFTIILGDDKKFKVLKYFFSELKRTFVFADIGVDILVTLSLKFSRCRDFRFAARNSGTELKSGILRKLGGASQFQTKTNY